MPEQVRCAADKGLHFLLQQCLLNENYRHFLKARNEHFSPRHLTKKKQQHSHPHHAAISQVRRNNVVIHVHLKTTEPPPPPPPSSSVYVTARHRLARDHQHGLQLPSGSTVLPGELTVWNTVIITRGRSGTISANKSPPHPSYPLQPARTIEAGDLYHK